MPATTAPVRSGQSSRLYDIDKLDNKGTNFTVWKYRISRILIQRGLWRIVAGVEPCPDSSQDPTGYADWLSRDEDAVTQITLTLSDEPLSGVMHLDTSVEVWDKLTSTYEGKGKQTVASLIGELFRDTLSDESPLQPQLDAMLHKKHLLATLGQPLDDSLVAIAMVISLPPTYSTLRTILMSSDTTLSTDKVVTSVLDQEKLLATEVKHSAFAARLSKGAPKPDSKSGGGKKPKSDKPKCAHCKKLGHKKEECRKLKAELEARAKSETTNTNKGGDLNAKVARTQDGDTVLRTFVANAIEAGEDSLSARWLVDSGASAHMSSERHKFCSYRKLASPKRVWLGDERYILAVGEGSMYLDLDGHASPILIQRVFHVPNLHGNLLSVSRLAAGGYTVKFVEDGCHFVDDGSASTVGTASLQDGLYVLNGQTSTPEHAHVAALDPQQLHDDFDPGVTPEDLNAFVANASKASVDVWHSRLAHLSVDAVLRMVRKGMVNGMSIIGESKPPKTPCATCLAGKQTRDPIPKSTTATAPRVNYRISSDLMESDTLSYLGERYLDTYVDWHSRHITVYPLKAKSDQPATLDAHINRVEVLVGEPVNILRSDGGGEYDNKDVKAICTRRGIHHEMTNPDTPQENGIAERANRTIEEMVRCMLQEAKLPKKYWAEAAKYATHILNRTPTRALDRDITPHEAYTGIKPSVAHIRPFGCKAYVHIPAKKRAKFDAKSLECVLLGYCEHKRAYRLLHRPTGRIVESRDVVFDEGNPNSVPTRIVVNTEPVFSQHSENATSSSPVTVDLPDTNPGHSHPSRRVTVEEVPDEGDAPVQGHGVIDEEEVERNVQLDQDEEPELEPQPPLPRQRRRVPVSNAVPGPYPHPIPAPALRRSARARNPVERYTSSKGQPQHARTSHSTRAAAGGGAPQAETAQAEELQDEEDDVEQLLAEVGDEQVNRASINDDPKTYAEAMSRPDAEQWKAACAEELLAFAKAELYDEVERPRNRKVVDCKWVFKIKRGADGEILRYKARLVAKGFTQVEGVDYTDTFAPVSKFASIRTLLALAAKHNLDIHQMDVKSAFLNGELEEEIYMEPPPGFRKDKSTVWRLWKSLYGLKQASREWYKKFRSLFEDLGYTRSNADHAVFYKRNESGELIIVAVYVDDMLIFGKGKDVIKRVKHELGVPYEMTDLGEAHWILGMEVLNDQARRTITLSQRRFIEDILETQGMSNCRPVSTPMAANQKLPKLDAPEVDEKAYQSALGSLMYVMLGTRPDIAFAVGALSKHAACPGKEHWNALMRVYKYLRGTTDRPLVYDGSPSCPNGGALLGYTDADWASDINDRRSVSGYTFLLSNAAVSWQSKKQASVAQSSTEAEYIALAAATKEALWIRTFLSEIYGTTYDAVGGTGTLLLADNQSAMALAKNSTFHDRTKHIAVRHHFIRDEIEEQRIRVEYIPTGDQVADVLTKALPREKHEKFSAGLGLA